MEQILEANPGELRGAEETDLVAHLAGCKECRAAADRIVAMEAGLGGWLGEVERGHGSTRGAPPVMGGGDIHPGAVRIRRRRTFWTVFFPAAAAALVGLFLYEGGPAGENDPVTSLISQGVAAGLPPLVESSPGKNVVVLETQDPKITLVWLY
jgi:hypothetical protein